MHSRKKLGFAIAILFLFSFAIQSCRAPEEEDDDKAERPIRVSWPSSDRVGIRDAELPPFDLEEESFVGSGRFNSVFWLDFEGATVSARDSFIVRNSGRNEVTIPPFSPADINSPEQRADLKRGIIQALAPLFPDVDIRLTLTRPSFGTFSRVHIGGDNFTGRPGVLGIAPLDFGNRVGNDILFVYSKVLQNISSEESGKIELTHAIAHEIAHSLGARHINNEGALMKTSIAVDADSFNLSGPVVDAPAESENSLLVLLRNAGSRSAALAEGGLPTLVNLDAFASGDVIQYTVFSRENMLQNPGLSLNKFRYDWEFEGKEAEGTSVLMTFDDRTDHLLKLTISDDKGASRSFQFSVGRRR